MEFNERLKLLRKKENLTQSDFAEKTGVHFQTVSKWERGASMPDIAMLGIIAKVLNVSLETLLGVNKSENTVTGDFNTNSIANAIADYRKRIGFSQSELAEKLEVSSDAVSKWERGITMPDIDLLMKMATLFGVSPSLLYYGVKIEDKIEEPVFYTKSSSKKWMIFSLITCALFIISIIGAVIFFPWPKEKVYHVISLQGVGEFKAENSSLFSQPNPEKMGYKFVKWVNEQGEEVQMPCVVEDDLTLLPVFEVVEYKIDYWTNGGKIEETAVTSITVESRNVELPIPEKTGETFLGWYLSNEYLGESVTALTCTYTNVTLYAKWSSAVFGVRYVLNGGVMLENPLTATTSESILLTEPTKTGYLFLGWYDEPDGGNKYTEVGGKNAKNLTLYALWQKITATYTVNYVLNGGTMQEENASVLHAGESIKLKDPQKTGYNFLGWYDENSETANRYEWLTGEKDITLYALFTPKEYILRYEFEGVYENQINPSFITYGEEITLNKTILEGHDFIGWYTDSENGNKIEVINSDNIDGLSVLYARYVAKIFPIKLIAGPGMFEIDGLSYSEYIFNYEYGSIFELPTCQRTNYTFLYWANETGEIYTQINKANYHLTALYAHFFATNGCEINYITDGGELVGDVPQRFYAGESIQLPTAEKEGYIFLGWNENAEGSGTWYTVTPNTDKEILDIYAIYQDVIVGGDGENFTYEMSATQVTITDYTGKYGDEVNVIIPEYIEGLPVTKLAKGVFGSSEHDLISLKSIILPKTLREIEEESMRLFTVETPLIIPASVTKIDKNAFFGDFPSIIFEKDSELTVLSENAFGGARVFDVFEVPEGVQEICSYALPYEAFGYILPRSLRKVHSHVFGEKIGVGQIYLTVYLPSGVIEVGENAFGGAKVYTDIEKQTLDTFDQNWCCNFAGVAKEYTLTLMDGNEKLSEQQGVAFNLPYLEKRGYNFVGWELEDGTPVCKAFINEEFTNVTLYARFSTAGKNDGTSRDNPIIVDCNKGAEFVCYTGKPFYMKFIITGPYALNFYLINAVPTNATYNIHSMSSSVIIDYSTWLLTSENEILGGEETKTCCMEDNYYGYVTYDTFKFVPVVGQ